MASVFILALFEGNAKPVVFPVTTGECMKVCNGIYDGLSPSWNYIFIAGNDKSGGACIDVIKPQVRLTGITDLEVKPNSAARIDGIANDRGIISSPALQTDYLFLNTTLIVCS